MSDLRETFVNGLKDVYDAEKQLTKALPKLAKAAEDDDLSEAFETHLAETKEHINRLEQVFEIVGEKPKAKKCKAMQGLVEEGSELISEEEGDAALIAAAQKVEHYEIAAYGSLMAWAKSLDEKEAIKILQETLKEEKETDSKLTQLAETVINAKESEESEEEEVHTERRR
jgi:ferritin-like metal-binding protein YciE